VNRLLALVAKLFTRRSAPSGQEIRKIRGGERTSKIPSAIRCEQLGESFLFHAARRAENLGNEPFASRFVEQSGGGWRVIPEPRRDERPHPGFLRILCTLPLGAIPSDKEPRRLKIMGRIIQIIQIIHHGHPNRHTL
jgi:hypothetical protein